ncbi:MAG: hypothetical protein CL764_04220 [Chloroflexi bacterium]|nr:hypothetical protein [Chloroflexota bacterium]|tara:strand:- start:1398 stop:1589 length:192 start_codon:yes stop_codon:yes gene_type:complete
MEKFNNLNRKNLLLTLNIVLVIFVILEILIWNKVSDFLTEEELAERRIELMKKSQKMSSHDNP